MSGTLYVDPVFAKLVASGAEQQAKILAMLQTFPKLLDTYLPSPRNGYKQLMPLLHFFTLTDAYPDVVRYLLQTPHNTSLRTSPENVNILCSCHKLYLDKLIQVPGKHWLPTKEERQATVWYLLSTFGWQRLHTLLRQGAIPLEEAREAAQQLRGHNGQMVTWGTKALEAFFAYLTFSLCKSMARNESKTTDGSGELRPVVGVSPFQLVKDGVATLARTFKYAKKNLGYDTLPIDVVDTCVKNYVYKVLELYEPQVRALVQSAQVAPPTYHEFITPSDRVALLRPLLNDGHYRATCKICHVTPHKELFARPSFT
jgi:hypothetical protein